MDESKDVSNLRALDESVEPRRLVAAALWRRGRDALVCIDDRGLISAWNPAAEALLGHRGVDIVGRPATSVLPAGAVLALPDPHDQPAPDDQPDPDDPARRRPEVAAYEHLDGTARQLEVDAVPLLEPDGTFAGSLLRLTDITEKVETEAVLQNTEARFRGYFEHAAVGVCRATLEGRLVEVNPALGRILGYQPEELVGRLLVDLVHPDDLALTVDVIASLATNEVGWIESDRRYLRKDGKTVNIHFTVSRVPATTTLPAFLAVIAQDVTDKRAAEDELAHQALHDPLTGLANRAHLQAQVVRALARIDGDETVTAVLFFDLDQFKLVNDALGHAVGDELLREVAARLASSARDQDGVARLGGDEFVVLCEGLKSPVDATHLASRLLEALAEPFVVAGRQLFVTASVGVATTPAPDADTVLREADAAMYQAKELGRNRYALFTPGLYHRTSRRLRLASEIHGAMEGKQFRLEYQPVVRLPTGDIYAVETLLRWEHPTDGLRAPDEFVNVAEDIGMIATIGDWVMDEGCRAVSAWQDERPGLAAYVNVSPRQFSETFADDVLETLTRHDLSPACLILDIKEQAVMTGIEGSVSTLTRLRDAGVRISIDDFGTGHSSLAHLRGLPVDELKIAPAFVQRLGGTDHGDVAIVASIVNLAHAFGLRAVAEGVETAAQAETLVRLGCDMAQGFYYGRPVVPDLVPNLVRHLVLPDPGAST